MAEQPTYPHDINKDYVWWIEDNQIAIAYVKDTATSTRILTDGSYNSVKGVRQRSEMGEFLSPHEVSTIRLHVIKKAGRVGDEGNSGGLVSLTDIPELPSQFHEALVHYAIFKGYERSSEGLENAAYFKAEYQRNIIDGRRYTNTRRMGGPRTVSISKKAGIR